MSYSIIRHMNHNSTRARIVQSADDLFYRHGFGSTSFADIADAVGISRGNFYHHFKSKDQILASVIALRTERTHGMLEHWENESSTPEQRIGSFIRILIANRANIMRHGCPVGTLCSELTKLDHEAKAEAGEIFGLFRFWLRDQFALTGMQRAEADRCALHLLARSQGVATLASAIRDPGFLEREVQDMHAWVNACIRQTDPRRT